MATRMTLSRFMVAVGLILAAGPARAFKRTAVGERVKDFTLQTLGCEDVNLLRNLGDKATVIVFWATWSPRSAEALMDFQKLYETYRDSGLQVIGVNVEHQEWDSNTLEEVKRFVGESDIGFPLVIDRDLEVFNAYGVIAVPSLLLADTQGKIVALLEGYAYTTRDGFKEQVLELLGVLKRQPIQVPKVVGYRPKGKAERYTRMGELLLQREVPHRAVLAFRKAIREDPEYARAYEGLARAYELLGRDQEAAKARVRAGELKDGRTAEKTNGSGADTQEVSEPGPAARRYYRMGMVFMDRNLYRAAESSFRKALDAAPGWDKAAEALAKALEAEKRMEKGSVSPGPSRIAAESATKPREGRQASGSATRSSQPSGARPGANRERPKGQQGKDWCPR